MITSPSDRPLYRRIADQLRTRITAGEFDAAGLPAEKDLRDFYGTSNVTIRNAVRVLVAEGLVSKRPGARTRVRDTPLMAWVRVDLAGREIGGRGATEAEAAQYGIPVGAPMLTLIEVTVEGDGSRHELELDAWPADRTRLRQ